ncbi:hypothetical protein N0V90_011309 [Kalmusia sp. IMI 367209]|nr:hypothetical protein N0V90_011309 [Kalmusia sp. IMI 367209]
MAQQSDQKLDGQGMRAIGVSLFYAEFDDYSPVRRKELRSIGMSYLADSLELTENDDFKSGRSLVILSGIHMDNKDRQKALETIEAAITTYVAYNRILKTVPPTPFRQKDLWNNRAGVPLWSLLRTKASYLAKLKRNNQAIQAYEESRRLIFEEFKGFLTGEILKEMAQLFNEDEDPDGHRFMNVLKTWKDQERHLWIYYHLIPYANLDALGRMFRASKLTGETSLVLEWLEKYEKKLRPRSLVAFNLQYALADYHSSVIRNVDEAKATVRSILMMQPMVNASTRDDVDEEMSNTRPRLAGIIFSQFSSFHDPVRKEELMEELKQIPGIHGEKDGFQESHIGMLYANMLRVMGLAREYQKYMDGIFEKCVNGLKDGDYYNDSPALRLLAKVLSCMEGLDFDARVAISARVSVLNQNI